MVINTGIKLKSWFLVVFTVLILVSIFYSKIFDGFFQHDEWQTFATVYLKNYGIFDIFKDAFLPRASHFDPFFGLTFNLFFTILGLNYLGYAIVSIMLHLLVVSLVFVLALYLTKKLIIAGMSALLFGLNASSHQATSWIIANINTHGATIFGLLSLIIFIRFLKNDMNKLRMLFLSLILLVISLMFKEIAIGFLALLPVTLILLSKTKLKKRKIYLIILFGLGAVYFSLRLSMLLMPVSDGEYVVTNDQNIKEVVYNMLTFPAKIFTQSAIPTWQLLDISKAVSFTLPDFIAGRPGTTEFDQFVENRSLQLVDFSVFIFAVVMGVIIWKIRAEKRLKKIIVLSFVFVVFNSFIYALSPGRSGSIPVIDSRNIYFPAIGTSIFISSTVYIIARGRLIRIILILTPLILLHMYWLNEQLTLRTSIGVVRKGILQQIKREHPDLPEKIVFYVASDTAYYGMAENIPPFETGLGQALLVWYHATEKFPTELFENRFLRFITDQGYRETGGRGFGYFRDFSMMKETIEKNNLSVDSVISYNYYGKTNVLQESTAQTREKLIKLLK